MRASLIRTLLSLVFENAPATVFKSREIVWTFITPINSLANCTSRAKRLGGRTQLSSIKWPGFDGAQCPCVSCVFSFGACPSAAIYICFKSSASFQFPIRSETHKYSFWELLYMKVFAGKQFTFNLYFLLFSFPVERNWHSKDGYRIKRMEVLTSYAGRRNLKKLRETA